MQGLAWTALQLPLAAGLQQKSDDRARQPPYLDVALDVQFDELGGVQTRKPFSALGTSIVGGGNISNPRHMVENGDELLLFTDTALYSWNEQLSKWVSKGTHLAVKVDEEPVFVTTGDQINCDRAELSNTIVYAWQDGTKTYVASVDKTTGMVSVGPTALAGTAVTPRLVALSTKILLFYAADISSADFCVKAIDPADVATGIASVSTTVLAGPNYGICYDVVKIPSADTAILAIQRGTTTSYTIAKVTAGLTVTTSTKGRTADGPIAVSCEPTGTSAQIIRTSSGNVQGDFITIGTLADVTTAQAVGTTSAGATKHIAACHRSTTDSGSYRCYAFWSLTESASGGTDWTSKYNYVDTGGTIGTQANFIRKLGVASRAFDHGGHVFVSMAFAGSSSFVHDFGNQLQNTYFLYRDDATLHAKMLSGRAGGFASDSWLPGVTTVDSSTYAWCGTQRRIIPLGPDSNGYSDRGPCDVMLTFDSNEARRTVKLGPTLYVTGGEIMQYDGSSFCEVGFHIYPWYFVPSEDNSSGSVADGTYAFKITYRSDNTKGDRDRSTTANAQEVSLTGGGTQSIDLDIITPLYVTHRSATINGPAVEVWRTAANPTADAPFFLASSSDPAGTDPNGYLLNDPTSHTFATFDDEFADATLTTKETDPETGGVLENLAPPPATIILASDTRIFLAGIAGDPDRVWYSKLRSPGQVASFHDGLTITIPSDGGDITALAFLNETLIVFRETAIYACAGDGFDNVGGGVNYGPARQLALGCGAVNHESVVATPGGLLYKSNKGWYLLNRGWSAEYIGGAVSDYDDETPVAVHLVETQHQVRILTGSRMLVWDYLANQWAEWSIANGLAATVWQGTYAYLATTGAMLEADFADTSLTYGLDVETAWIKPADLQGGVSIRWIEILGEFMSEDWTHLRVRVAYDYNDTFIDDKYVPITPDTGTPFQLRYGQKRPKCEAVKYRITPIRRHTTTINDVEVVVNDPPTGEALKLTGIGLEVGSKRGLYRRLSADQKA